MGSKIILITGSSNGIGAATALLASQQGYTVCIHYHTDEKGAKGVQTALEKNGNQAFIYQANLGLESDILSLFGEIKKDHGRLDALVNNAGITMPQLKLESMDTLRLHKIFAINTIGTILCCKAAIQMMSIHHGGQGGVIINVSSMAAVLGGPFEYVDYAASKGAVDSLTIGLSKELAGDHIRVNGVRPGVIHTDIHAKSGEPNRVDRVAATVPMQRGGQPVEVAEAIMWLVSDAASYVTGSFIHVSGGR